MDKSERLLTRFVYGNHEFIHHMFHLHLSIYYVWANENNLLVTLLRQYLSIVIIIL